MGIVWITGNSEAGKTTLANALKAKLENDNKDIIILDGDEIRKSYDKPLGFSRQDRWKHNINVALMAVDKSKHYDLVIVSVICPFKQLRKKVKKLCKCKFIYIEGGKESKSFPYDHPKLY